MGHLLAAKTQFDDHDAAEFRLYVLAGCRKLSCEEVRSLADELHECAQARGSMADPLSACCRAAAAELLEDRA